jgi:hypothetical protein
LTTEGEQFVIGPARKVKTAAGLNCSSDGVYGVFHLW